MINLNSQLSSSTDMEFNPDFITQTLLEATPRTPSLRHLHYKDRNGWIPLPDWAWFFLQTGQSIASMTLESRRLIAGYTIPTKAFAATLLATGVVAALASEKIFTKADIDARSGFFRDLKANTPLVYRRLNNSFQKCQYDRWYSERNVPHIRVITQSDKSASILPDKLMLGVDVLDDPDFCLPRRQSTRRIVSQEEMDFLTLCLGKVRAQEHIAYSRLDCLVIGSKEQLHQEMCEERVAVMDSNGTITQGALQVLARMKELSTNSSGWRSSIVAPGDTISGAMPPCHPTVVVFNGATAFLKSRDNWRSSHWIVLLDRTEARFSDAVAELNQEFIIRRVDESPITPSPMPPKGIEAVWYCEELQ